MASILVYVLYTIGFSLALGLLFVPQIVRNVVCRVNPICDEPSEYYTRSLSVDRIMGGLTLAGVVSSMLL